MDQTIFFVDRCGKVYYKEPQGLLQSKDTTEFSVTQEVTPVLTNRMQSNVKFNSQMQVSPRFSIFVLTPQGKKTIDDNREDSVNNPGN